MGLLAVGIVVFQRFSFEVVQRSLSCDCSSCNERYNTCMLSTFELKWNCVSNRRARMEIASYRCDLCVACARPCATKIEFVITVEINDVDVKYLSAAFESSCLVVRKSDAVPTRQNDCDDSLGVKQKLQRSSYNWSEYHGKEPCPDACFQQCIRKPEPSRPLPHFSSATVADVNVPGIALMLRQQICPARIQPLPL